MSDGRGRPETLAPDNGSRRRPEQLLTPDARTAAEALATLGKGDILVGGTSGPVVVPPGLNGDLLVYDSTQPSGLRPMTQAEFLAGKYAWYHMESLVLDFANGLSQYVVLANGANAITGMSNAIPGVNYKIKLIQPASGAAGTITLAATGTDTVKIAGALTLSQTNGMANYLFLVYDDVTAGAGAGVFTAFVSQEF